MRSLLRAALLACCLAVAAAGSAAEVRVFAAASLTDALREIGPAYRKATGDYVFFNFGASSTLARQLAEGAPADVFLSADDAKMDVLARSGRIVPSSRFAMLSNTLVVVVPPSARTISSARDLASPRFTRIAIAQPQLVPAGIYARSWLVKAGLWSAVSSKVVPTDNVRSALAAVESRDVDAAIVYETDARASRAVRVALRVPSHMHAPIRYPFAIVRDAGNPGGARRFLDYLRSPAARRIFARHGFIVR